MVTISVDPENDTPERLREYAEELGAGDGWHFLTGEPSAVETAWKAFDAYVPNKARHEPLTFLRGSNSKQWTRLNGLISATDLTAEIRHILPKK